MSETLVLTAPGVLSAPLPGTPILRLSGDVTVLAADAFTGVDGTLVHGRATTPAPGRAALPWSSTAGARLSDGTMIQGDPATVGFTWVEIPDHEPPATYEVSFKVVSLAAVASTFIDVFRDVEATTSTKLRLTLDGTAMTARLATTIPGSSGASLGPSFAFAFGDVLGIRAHPTAGTVSVTKNGVAVQSYTGQPAAAGRLVGLANAAAAWQVDDFRLVQTLD